MVIASSLTGVVPVVPLPNYTWGLLRTYKSWDDPPSFPGFSSFTVIHHPMPCHRSWVKHPVLLRFQAPVVRVQAGPWKGGRFRGSGPGGYTNSWMCLKSTGFVFAEFSTHKVYKIRKVNTAGTCCKYVMRKKGKFDLPNKPPGNYVPDVSLQGLPV